MVDITNQLGTELAISAAAPATQNTAGFEALTWAVVGGVLNIPRSGDASETITADVLAEGRRQLANGTLVGTEMTIPYLLDTADAGQVIIAANVNSNTLCSIRVTDASSNIYYQTGYIGSMMEGDRSTGSARQRDFVFRPTKAPVFDDA